MTLDDIDYRCKVGTEAWHRRTKAKKLSAWRRLHALMPHAEVVKVANMDMSIGELLEVIAGAENG